MNILLNKGLTEYIIIYHNYLNNVSYSLYSHLQCLSNLKPNYPFKLGVIYLTYYEMLSKLLFTHTGTAVFYSINCYVLVCTLSIRLNIDG